MKIKKLTITTIISALALLIMVGNVQAQKKYVNKAALWAEKGEKLDTALGSVKFAETQEKTKDWYKTYYVKGLIYQAVAKTEIEEFKKLSEYPLIDALENFSKAYNMKGSKAIQSTLDMNFLNMAGEIINKAIEYYQSEDYATALKYFEASLDLKKMEVFESQIDTAIIFNAAITAQRAKEYDKAIKYYKESIIYNYGQGDTYSLLAEVYKSNNNTDLYLNALKEGFEKYPDNQSLLGNIINYFLLEAENTEEAFKYLKVAREGNPDNPQFYSAEAHLYDKIGDKEKAKEHYLKAIELNQDFFEAHYNLGVIYFNEGVALTDKANEITDNAKYEEAKKVADQKFLESLPYIEKAHELQPEESSIIATLKTLYYRLKMTEKYESISNK